MFLLSFTVAITWSCKGVKGIEFEIQSDPVLENPAAHFVQVFASEHVAHFTGHFWHPFGER